MTRAPFTPAQVGALIERAKAAGYPNVRVTATREKIEIVISSEPEAPSEPETFDAWMERENARAPQGRL